MIATLPSSLMRALPRTRWRSLPPAAAREQAVQELAKHAPDGGGARDEEVMAAGEELHGGAAERPGGRAEPGLVHDLARRPAEHDRGAADAAQVREEVPCPVPLERQHRAVEAERPVPGRALEHRVVGEVRDHRRRDAGLVWHEAEGRERSLTRRIAAPVPLAGGTRPPPR